MNPKRESLRRKHAARMAAVQAIYSYALSSPAPSEESLIEQISQQWKESTLGRDAEWPGDDLPEPSLLRDVISGTITHYDAIEARLTHIIKDNWKADRMDPVLLAILYCAVYELEYRPDRKAHIICDEYTTIAGDYFDGSELGFVHSALQQLLPVLRP